MGQQRKPSSQAVRDIWRPTRTHSTGHHFQVVALGSTFGYRCPMTGQAPREITQRELRNDSGAIMRGVERGESFTITRNGTPIGRLIPLRRRTFVPRDEVLAAFATAPVLDPERFRADLDAAVEQDPSNRAW